MYTSIKIIMLYPWNSYNVLYQLYLHEKHWLSLVTIYERLAAFIFWIHKKLKTSVKLKLSLEEVENHIT